MGIGSTWEPTPTAGSAHPDATPSPGELVIIMPDVSKISYQCHHNQLLL